MVDKVLHEAGVETSEISDADEEQSGLVSDSIDDSADLEEEGIAEITLQDLNQLLEQALVREDYEEAARLRDEINRRS